MLKKFLFLIAMAVASVGGLFAQAFDPMAPVPQDPDVRVGVLDNGLTFYIRHNPKPANQAEFYIFHNVGAIQEEDSQQGLAHFLEHMAFNGTKNLPGKQLINWLESVGVKFGANLNAGTGMEMTVYNMSAVPLNRESIIDSALLILHDWSYFITLDGAEIDKERGVIVEELRTRNTAGWRIYEKSMPYLYGDTRYANRNLIGYEDFLRTFDHQALRDFYHRWYRTDQQVLVIVGDFDAEMMENKLRSVMSDIPAVENPVPKEVIELPSNTEPVVGVLTDPELNATSVSFYIKRPALPAQINNLTAVYFQNMLDMFVSEIANERLRDIAQKPGAPFTSAQLFMSSNMTVTTDAVYGRVSARDGEALKAFQAFYTEVEKIARFGFTESEFERAKARILRRAQQQYDNRADRRSEEFVWTYISNFRDNTYMPSAEDEWDLDQKMLDFITLDYVNMMARERLQPENQIILVSAPEKEGTSVPTVADILAAVEAVRSAELEAPVDNSVSEPLIPAGTVFKGSKVKKTADDRFGSTVWTLKNGVKVVVQPTDYKTDEILLDITSGGGLSVLADNEVMTANNLPGYVIQAGVGKFNASDLRKQLTGKAVSLRPSVGGYTNGFVGSASPKDIETLMQLTYLYFTSPRFDRSDFDVMIDRMKAQYSNIASNPMFVLNDSLTNILYDHNPRRQMLTLERIDQIDYDLMEPIYSKLYSNPADFTFTFVGNVNPDELKPLVEKYLGSLPKAKKSFSWKDDGVRFVEGKVNSEFTVPMQMPKTSVLFTLTGETNYSLRDVLLLESLSQILDIRYTESIREEKGGTYGVQTMAELDPVPVRSYLLLIAFDTDPAMARELSEAIFVELRDIASEGVRADDLAKVKEYFAKQHPDDLRQNSHWLDVISEYHMYGYDMNTGFMDIVNGITGDDLKGLTARILDDGNVVSIMMSDE